jgi:hypothetical protein
MCVCRRGSGTRAGRCTCATATTTPRPASSRRPTRLESPAGWTCTTSRWGGDYVQQSACALSVRDNSRGQPAQSLSDCPDRVRQQGCRLSPRPAPRRGRRGSPTACRVLRSLWVSPVFFGIWHSDGGTGVLHALGPRCVGRGTALVECPILGRWGVEETCLSASRRGADAEHVPGVRYFRPPDKNLALGSADTSRCGSRSSRDRSIRFPSVESSRHDPVRNRRFRYTAGSSPKIAQATVPASGERS